MRVRKFEGSSIDKVLKTVKKEMGPEAFILSTREVHRENAYGITSPSLFDVTAGIDSFVGTDSAAGIETTENIQQNYPAHLTTSNENSLGAEPVAQKNFTELQTTLKKIEEGLREQNKLFYDTGLQRGFSDLKVILYEILKSNTISRVKRLPDNLIGLFNQLKVAEVKETLILKLFKTILKKSNSLTKSSDKDLIVDYESYYRDLAIRTMLNEIPISGGLAVDGKDKPQIITFKGLSGSGKTTSLAKLAAQMILKKKLQVGIISLDNYRIAANEQLKTFAKILKTPFYTAANKLEYQSALSEIKDSCDLILVDQPSRMIKGKTQELNYLDEVSSDMSHLLVLPAIGSRQYLENCLDLYQSEKVDGLLMTYLDEVPGWGEMYNISIEKGIPYTYFSCGQRVPEDLEVATKERVIEGIFRD